MEEVVIVVVFSHSSVQELVSSSVKTPLASKSAAPKSE